MLAIGIGVISWSGECVALYFAYVGLDIVASFDVFIKTVFIGAVSSLIDSASGLPGGPGTADSNMIGLTVEDDREGNNDTKENTVLVATRSGEIKPELPSATVHSGEKVNENAHHYSNL